jgi:hypothetical protein
VVTPGLETSATIIIKPKLKNNISTDNIKIDFVIPTDANSSLLDIMEYR